MQLDVQAIRYNINLTNINECQIVVDYNKFRYNLLTKLPIYLFSFYSSSPGAALCPLVSLIKDNSIND